MGTNQTMAAQEAGRPQPQTTVEPAGGPFVRHSQPGRGNIYTRSGDALGATITQPLTAKPGYYRNFRVTHTLVTGGAITSGVVQPDAPYNLSSLIQLKDAFGTPLIVAPGYEVANLIGMFGGHFGLNNGTNIASGLPSWTALSNTTGAGQFSYALPLEFSKAYGVLSAANASLQPTLQFNFAPMSALLGAGTGTAPTVNTVVDSDFYWLPEGVAIEPPGLGTTRQWLLQNTNPPIGASSSVRAAFPRMGGYLDTIVMIVRDSTNARSDGFFPTRLQLYVDGIPMIDSSMVEIFDDMAIQFGAVTRPTGVIAISRKNSLNQQSMGLLDTGETYLSTNPGTLLEAGFAPAGAGSNSPAQMSALVGQIVPTGAVIQGLPEL